MGIVRKAQEKFRDKTVDELCAALRAIGLNASMVRHGESVAHMYRDLGKSQGLIEVANSPIPWVDVVKGRIGSGEVSLAAYTNIFLFPDSNVSVREGGHFELEFVRVRSMPLFGSVIDLNWKPYFVKTKGFSISRQVSADHWISDVERNRIGRMNEDISLKQRLIKLREDITIRSLSHWGWALISKKHPGSWFGRASRQLPPSREQWDCYETIARHILESSGK